MEEPVRMVRYSSQFFGKVGGEERAQTPLEVREGSAGARIRDVLQRCQPW